MTVSVRFFVYDGIAYAPSDISWGDAQSIGIDVDNNGQVIQAGFTRPSLQLSAKGIDSGIVQTLHESSKSNRLSLVIGSTPSLKSITVSGRSIQAFLSKVEPSGYITVAGHELIESCRINYEAIEFE